jgi:outer membrane autotransporter protein
MHVCTQNVQVGHRVAGKFNLLASSSIAALLLAAGTPAWAACSTVISGQALPSVSNPGASDCITITNSAITGDVTNNTGATLITTGTAAPSKTGIQIVDSSIGGSVSNAGVISASGFGIFVEESSISNGITNSSTISAGASGITILSETSFSGGVSNSGTITATGIAGVLISGDTSFAGGIENSGQISAAIEAIAVDSSTNFSGGITNASTGLLSSGQSGIVVSAVSGFSGSISNAGTISAVNIGINVDAGSMLGTSIVSSGITNSGTISAFTGISISDSTINGSIVDSGTINATNLGIVIDSQSQINATATGIAVTGPTFTGGISNAGTISAAAAGILVGTPAGINPGPTSFSGGIVNSGLISSSASPAIEVALVSAFSGGITNTGTLSALDTNTGTGIAVGEVTSFSGGISNSGLISAGVSGIKIGGISVFSGNITNDFPAAIDAGQAGIAIEGVTTFDGSILNFGQISSGEAGISVGASFFTGSVVNIGTITAGAASGIAITGATSFSGGVSNFGTISAAAAGIATIFNSDFSGGISNSGTISAVNFGILLESISAFSGDISNSGTISGVDGIAVESGVSFATGSAIVNSGTLIGTISAINALNATSPVTIDQEAGLISGAIKLSTSADVVNISGGTINGNIIGQGASDTINFVPGAGNRFTYGPSYGFTGINQVNVNSGTTILDGANSATNVTVNGGTLEVGDAADTGAILTITGTNPLNVSGTLAGHGTVAGDVAVASGGTLSPGGSIGTLTIDGDLTLSAGSTYAVEISPTQASKTQITGTATLGGATVVATVTSPQLGSFEGHTYTILSATDVIGTFNPKVTFAATGLTSAEQITFENAASLSYDPNDVDLSLIAPSFVVTLALPSNAPTNAQHVGGAINQFIVNGGTLPAGFQNLVNFSGAALNNAVNSLAGQTQGSFVPVGFDAGTMFLNLLLNPFIDGREAAGGFGGPSAGSGLAYASDEAKPAAYQALASALSPAVIGFAPHISLWASAYGGEGTIGGDTATGAASSKSQIYGFAAGADDHVAPDTMFGLAIGGGGTNWQLNGLGDGSSGLFQMGAYGTRLFGPAYVSGALAYSLQDVRNSRDAEVGTSDPLNGDFVANVLSGRIEGGYHLPFAALTLTPYGAVQSQTMFLPSYGEVGVNGASPFALTYDGRATTDTRTEVGAWFDTDVPSLLNGNVKFYGRAAFAHDFENEGSATAFFQSLPGSGSFIVDSAKPDDNSALVTAGLEYKLGDGWSVLAKFDGEFSGNSTIVGGTGVLRKVW